MIKYDLHVHSTNSDGKYSKVELLKMAQKNNIEAIAFCDHNDCSNINSIEIQRQYEEKFKEKNNILIIPAIEISCKSDNIRGIHILGYGIKKIEIIEKAIEDINNKNINILHEQIQLINKEFNIPINITMVEECAGTKSIKSRDIEEALLRNGFIKEKKEMYKFTNRMSKSHVNKIKMNDVDAINVIRASGGIAVLAHPIELRRMDGSLLGISGEYEEYIKMLKNNGLSGIETHTIKHSPMQQKEYYESAKKLGLLTTAGTDFHDEKRTFQLGVEYDANIFLKPLLKEIIKKHIIYNEKTIERDR